MKGYRFLKVGEVLRPGDEFSNYSEWVPSASIGRRIENSGKKRYRRKVAPRKSRAALYRDLAVGELLLKSDEVLDPITLKWSRADLVYEAGDVVTVLCVGYFRRKIRGSK